MKKVLSILMITVFTFGIISCEAESTADQEKLYIDAPDSDDVPDIGSPDSDDVPDIGRD